MGFSFPFTTPFYTGSGASSLVPDVFPVAINGHAYLVDTPGIMEQTIPSLRPQADTGNLPGEQSVSPEGLWPRSQNTWHKGAGQSYLDRPDSDSARFRSSKGIDPWTQWTLSLLADTDEKRASAASNLRLVTAGARLYLVDDDELLYTTDVTVGAPVWTAVTGHPAAAATSIASDGFKVYTAHGADGVYRTDTGSGAMAQLVTTGLTGGVVGYAKGRLLIGSSSSIYNVIDLVGPAGLPATPLMTHPNTAFRWVGFAEGPAAIYAAGYAGDKSYIYRTEIKDDATALDAPVVAGELPDGEIVRAIQGYLGFIVLGTDRGLRFCLLDGNGNLRLGDLIPHTSPVLCFEPQDRFVWYGLTDYDTESTGLGRLDLKTFTDSAALAPAYASDLMVTGDGDVLSVVTFQSIRVFTVSGLGVYAEDTDKVASGTLDTGIVTYSLPWAKVAMFVDVETEPLDGAVTVSLAADEGAWSVLGGVDIADSTATTLPAGQKRGKKHELRLTLTGDGAASPVLTRWDLRSEPAPPVGRMFTVPIILADAVAPEGGDHRVDVAAERAFIRALRADRTAANVQIGDETSVMFVGDYRWAPWKNANEDGGEAGVLTVTLKDLSE